MDKKVIELTKIKQETKADAEVVKPVVQKATNPIFKKLAQFQNSKLSQKFDINDLL